MPLLEHNVNIQRIKKGKRPATMIWLWGQGISPQMPTFKKKFKKSAAVITAVHLLKGLGAILGMEIINVSGATGFLDTNYKGKADAAIKAIKKHDVVFVHVEAPDECGHMGDVKGKIRAIEDFDKKIVGPILSWAKKHSDIETKILVLPDHPTPIKLMTHSSDPVPFVIYGSNEGIKASRDQGIKGYSEREIAKSKVKVKSGFTLLDKLLG
jgi:2,3-bisphosphoglycerate-independent phosphoglycerate mutase